MENYAVVEQARIRFGPGLTVLTGETGSGKSIVVDSFSLLLGTRASAEMIRSGEAKARVSGIFAVTLSADLQALLDEAGITIGEEEELIVEREIALNGKSRAFVANRPVTTAFLRQLAPALGDIHGQNESQSLFAGQSQRKVLDVYAHASKLLAQVSRAYLDWREISEKLRDLNQNEQEKMRLLDLWTFQSGEIATVGPKPGEDAALEAERKVLQNVTKLQESSNAAFALLYEAPESATTQLKQASKRLDELLRIDDTLAGVCDQMKQASVLLEEATYGLRDYVGKLEGDPDRLEDVESRLESLDKLKRKYGPTLEDVLEFGFEAKRKADEIENVEQHRGALEKQQAHLAAEYERFAKELRVVRKAAAEKLSRHVEGELKSLAMAGTLFQVEVQESDWGPNGFDEVRLLVSPNRGEEPKPLEKIASGGELSRIALALKTATGSPPESEGAMTMVFDEVDAGVGGAAAAAVGRRLKALSRGSQVICVTHTAQIAGFADHHLAVAKKERKGRVVTEIAELPRDERAREIGRMLSGEEITPEALRQAEQLMQAGMTV